ncbi:hypothetical protein [Streptomyces sp. NPDC002044]|uniref:hypothetical protein n=1 Tax=Streptomyces sp. NPDC002044 TaxID=3154662 RepID=UPI0033299308
MRRANRAAESATATAVTRLLDSDAFTGSGEPDFQFRHGLDRVLDGLATRINGSPPSTP